jgi:predicted porin
MKKHAIAVAVGALLAAPAAHAQVVFGNPTIGTVQLYGKLYPQIGSFKSSGANTTGATATLVAGDTGENHDQRWNVNSANSYIGFRGERALGSTGLKGIWQVEQAIELDTGNEDAVWSNRNSFLGVTGGFGTVKLGHMDTIYKEYGDVFSMFGIKSGNFVSGSNVLSHIGLGTSGSARFHERAPNSIQYETPEFGNITAGIQYSPDEERAPGVDQKVELWSMGVKWESKPFYVSLSHERHNDFFGGSNNSDGAFDNTGNPAATSKDSATRLSAQWTIGNHKLTGDIARMEWTESGQAAPGLFDMYEKTTWAIGWEARWGGPWETAVQYIRADEGDCTLSGGVACNTDGLDGSMLTGGVAYHFDRQTLFYLIAARLTNGESARYDNWANGNAGRGADSTQFALGMSYRF